MQRTRQAYTYTYTYTQRHYNCRMTEVGLQMKAIAIKATNVPPEAGAAS